VIVFPYPFHILLPVTNVGSSAFKDSFLSYGQEVALTSTRSFALQEGCLHLVEQESLSRDSFGPFLL
jgi:hypothetical protein